MNKVIAYINIGSNMGDRSANLSRAVALISGIADGTVRVSTVIESEPWGYDSSRSYFNVGMVIETGLQPEALLDRLQQVERAISPAPHRDSTGAYIDRIIDVDLIAYGDVVMDTPRLRLPHPAMAARRFVLEPLAVLLPLWRHPLTGLTAAEMLSALP